MPLWPVPTAPAAERAAQLHQELVGTAATHVASAPATWPLIGEHIDHYGGVTVMGLSKLRAAAAVSPRTDGVIAVTLVGFDATGAEVKESGEVTLDQLGELAAAQQPTIDKAGRTVLAEPPTGGLAERVGGVIYSLINRQQLSRETAGADITIASDIPADSGLGAEAAADVAVALAMMGDSTDLGEAPLRARIAEICAQAVDTFAATPALRARHTAALRGSDTDVTVVDYADGSVTHAPHPLNKDEAAFIITVPGAEQSADAVAEIRRRQRFIDAACHAFGAESLRLLPDAPQRVIEWLAAVHKVQGAEGQPTLAESSAWLNFYDEETTRAQDFTRALRSRRGADLYPLVTQSQSALNTMYALDSAEKIAELATLRGAHAARAVTAGTSQSVVAYVPARAAANFAADLADDGLIVVPLEQGAIAQSESVD